MNSGIQNVANISTNRSYVKSIMKGKYDMKLELIALLIVIIAVLSDLVVPIVIAKGYPNYNHFIHTVSTLGTHVSPVRKKESTNLKIVGGLLCVFALSELFLVDNWGVYHVLYCGNIIIFGIGSIVAGIFPEDVAGEKESMDGKIHGIASGLGFLLLGINPLLVIWIEELNNVYIVNIGLFVLATIFFILFLVSEKIEEGWLKYTGLFQRLNMVVLYTVIILNYLLLID